MLKSICCNSPKHCFQPWQTLCIFPKKVHTRTIPLASVADWAYPTMPAQREIQLSPRPSPAAGLDAALLALDGTCPLLNVTCRGERCPPGPGEGKLSLRQYFSSLLTGFVMSYILRPQVQVHWTGLVGEDDDRNRYLWVFPFPSWGWRQRCQRATRQHPMPHWSHRNWVPATASDGVAEPSMRVGASDPPKASLCTHNFPSQGTYSTCRWYLHFQFNGIYSPLTQTLRMKCPLACRWCCVHNCGTLCFALCD